ncbi:MAG: aldolase [Pseudomonadota bacterium]|nr:aldolase [Pseudomonadota bacterium]
MNEAEARDEICRVGRSLFDRGYVHATAGNISVCLEESEGGGYLITPTDSCLGFLDPARLARLDANARQVSGDRASKTIALHTEIYAAARRFDGHTACVIHTHSAHCVALSFHDHAGELLPPITPYFVMKVGHVPIIPYYRPGASDAARHVARVIQQYGEAGTPIRAVMLARLGPNVWHESPAAAMATLEELEETARLLVLAPAKTASLTDIQLDELRQAFGARW